MLWQYKIKNDGQLKARLCFDGRRQDPTTYDVINSPTMRLTTFRLLMAKSTEKRWSVFADDASQAFLNASRPADKPLYASYPQGFRRPGRCLLVQRMLYGLHDAPMGWFREVRKHMLEEQGMTQSRTDECLFTKEGLYVIVHVDDFLSTGTDAALQEFRSRLHAKFKMTGGPVSEYYGLDVKIDRERGTADIGCASYIKRMIAKLGVVPKVAHTPMLPDNPLPKMKGEAKDKKLQSRYRQICGSIMHPAVTCSDRTCVIGAVDGAMVVFMVTITI